MFLKIIENHLPYSIVRFSLLFIAILVPEHALTFDKEVIIYSRAMIEEFPHRQYVEYIGGSQTLKQKKWSYLAFVDVQGRRVEVGPSFKNLNYDVVTQFNSRYFWAFGAYHDQGSKSWVLLAISRDYGKSWKIVELNKVFNQASQFARQSIVVSDIIEVKFITPTDGTMEVLTEETSKRVVLVTKNGGFNWKVNKWVKVRDAH